MVDPDFLARHVDFVLDDATIPELPNHYRGKVRDNYDLPDGRRIIIATDRLSAFDRAIAAIPFKGQVLTQTARFWFDRTADLCPNHVLDYPDPNVLVVPRGSTSCRSRSSCATISPGRQRPRSGRCTGRAARDVRAPLSRRACARTRNCPITVITPTTKAATASMTSRSRRAEIIGRGLLTAAQWEEVSATALALFARGREIAAEARADPGRYEVRVRAATATAASFSPTKSTPRTAAATGSPRAIRAASRPASRPTASTRIFCAAGWRPAAIPTATRSRRSRARSSPRPPRCISVPSRRSPANRSPPPIRDTPLLARIRANLRRYF